MKENTMFESIKHIDENGKEYWLARELQTILDYTEWRKFEGIINKAIVACRNSNNLSSDNFVSTDKIVNVNDHFANIGKIVNTGVATKTITDYKLSRYACYLIAQEGDSRKKVIALAKTYFAIQTRKQELLERDYNSLTENEKRFYQRSLTKKHNRSLNETARDVGVKNFDKFHNAGYKGLYNGETADDIAKRKKLRYREDILDNMSSVELVDNLFRIVQTDERLKYEKELGEKKANRIHYDIGKNVREAIIKSGGTVPEKLETPNKSLKELEKDNKSML